MRIDSTEFSLSDGSGLSSANLISPQAFTRLLRYIRAHPRFATFAPGLPQAGGTGNLRTRFVGTPLAGRVRAKTGSIAGVNTLAGYIDRPDGKPITFAVEVNHHAQPSRAVLGGDRQRGGGDGEGQVARLEQRESEFHVSSNIPALWESHAPAPRTATPTPDERDPAQWPDDRDRPLTEKGRKVQAEVSPLPPQARPGADAGLTSPWTRAAQTAQILVEVARVPQPPVPCEPLADDPDLVRLQDYVGDQPSGAIVAMVGHSPWMEELGVAAAGGIQHRRADRLSQERGAGDRAGPKLEPGAGELRFFLRPKMA